MKYLDLFNELQLARDYFEDPKTGVNWRYHIDNRAKRIYVECQETKTLKDWFYNWLFIPKTVKVGKKKIIVPLGVYLQAKALFDYIYADYTNGKLPCGCDYTWYFVGWSLGGEVAGTIAFLLQNIISTKRHLIMYGTPAYCLGQKSLDTLCAQFVTIKNFIYENDWIKKLIPGYKRPESENVQPSNPDNPQTLDQRHRVYGHCIYSAPEF